MTRGLARALLLLLALLPGAAGPVRAQDDGPQASPDAAGVPLPGGALSLPEQDAGAETLAQAPAGTVLLGPEGPVLLGEPFVVLVRGPGLLEARLHPGEHADDIGVAPFERRQVGDESELRLGVQIAREGRFDLPMTVVTTSGAEAALPSLQVEVLLDLPPDREPRLAARLPPLAVPLPPGPTLPFALGLGLFLLALGTWIVLDTRHVVVVEVPVPAEALAREALARLKARLPASRDEMLPFTVEVSDVLRRYIEQRFALHAPARTTEEFLAEAGQRHDAVGARTVLLERFLEQCDLVKYARHRPEPREAGHLLRTVEGFVDETCGADDEAGPADAPADGALALAGASGGPEPGEGR